jgi:ribosome-binding protein aMBF1 (putative translation factor)
MPTERFANLGSVKKKVFKNQPEVKKEYEEMELVRKIQKKLIRARVNKGLSQTELAKLIDSNQSVISRLENSDDPNPNLKTISGIFRALDKKLDVTFVDLD